MAVEQPYPDSVYHAFCRAASEEPQRPLFTIIEETAAIYAIAAGCITYHEAMQHIRSLREAYHRAGAQGGQRVMVLLENRPDFFFHWLALNALRVSVVPLNPDLRRAELCHLINNAEPSLIVAMPLWIDRLKEAVRSTGIDIAVIAPGDPIPPLPRRSIMLPEGLSLQDEAALLYTSGTTGLPKGCRLSNDYFLRAGAWYAATGGLCALNRDGERMITPLPVFHMNALAFSFMAMVNVRGCLTLVDRFHPGSWWDSVRAARATCLHYLGMMPNLLMAASPSPADRDHQLRFGFGAGVNPELHADFETRFGFPLIEAWAMTETGAGAVIAANRRPRRVGAASFGQPEAPLEVRIVREDGRDVDAMEAGELWVRQQGSNPSRGFFSNYHKDDAATQAIWQEGWFHTGDIVRREPSGALIFVDRNKNMIRRAGENIAAIEVEAVLTAHPAIAAMAVIAVADALRGEEIMACIVAHDPPSTLEGAAATAEQIVIWALTQLAYFKVPGYVAFVETLPLTATQKIHRADLKAMASGLQNDPQTIDTRHLKRRPQS